MLSARWQVVAAQALLFLGALASEVTVAMERGEWSIDRLPAILMLACVGYMTKRGNDVTGAEAERRANDAFIRGVQLGRSDAKVRPANDNAAERASDAG